MKHLLLISALVLSFSSIAFAGGTDTKPVVVDKDGSSTGEGGTDTIFKASKDDGKGKKPAKGGTDTVTAASAKLGTRSVVAIKYIGETETSVFLQINNGLEVVEVEDAALETAELTGAVGIAAQTDEWVNL